MILGREAEFEELASDLARASPGSRERAEVLSRAQNPISAACTCHVLADYEEQRGRFKESLRYANYALTRLASARSKGREVDKLRAALLVMRGIAYAGLGSVDDAAATHDEVMKAFPLYAGLAAGAFRICFLAAAHVGEHEDAMQIADTRAEGTPICARDAFLIEAIRTLLGSSPAASEPLLARLRDDSMLGAWLVAAAPGVAQRLASMSDTRATG